MKVSYSVQNETMLDIKNKILQKIGKNTDLYFLTLSYTDASAIINLENNAETVRQNNKNRNIFAIEIGFEYQPSISNEPTMY